MKKYKYLVFGLAAVTLVGILIASSTTPEAQHSSAPLPPAGSEIGRLAMIPQGHPAAPEKTLKVAEKETAVSLVEDFFKAYNAKNFAHACDVMVDSKCDADRPNAVKRFSDEYFKMTNGYEGVAVRMSPIKNYKDYSIVCAEYDYTYKADTETKKINEVLSVYVRDGKIIHRVCESKTAGETSYDCPVLSAVDFCL